MFSSPMQKNQHRAYIFCIAPFAGVAIEIATCDKNCKDPQAHSFAWFSAGSLFPESWRAIAGNKVFQTRQRKELLAEQIECEMMAHVFPELQHG